MMKKRKLKLKRKMMKSRKVKLETNLIQKLQQTRKQSIY